MTSNFTYVGFSTIPADKSGVRVWTLYDEALIHRDLLNEFYTHKGERLGRPNYGWAGWDFLDEPLNDYAESEIEIDSRRICENDPRVEVVGLRVADFEHAIQVSVNLRHRLDGSPIQFVIEFERRNSADSI